MTRQQELVAYVALHNRCDDAAAQKWLDTHCPMWREEAGLIELPAKEAVDVDN